MNLLSQQRQEKEAGKSKGVLLEQGRKHNMRNKRNGDEIMVGTKYWEKSRNTIGVDRMGKNWRKTKTKQGKTSYNQGLKATQPYESILNSGSLVYLSC